MVNEFGRLSKGVGTIMKIGTKTIEFIKKSQVTQGKIVTYALIVAKLRPQKAEPESVKISVGGNLIDYPGDKLTPTIEITTIKIHLNSVMSTPEAKCLCTDVHYFYLNTIMEDPEYMRIKVELVPFEIMDQYEL